MPVLVTSRKGRVSRNISPRISNSYIPSRPARGVWVEIQWYIITSEIIRKSRPARGVWVEIKILNLVWIALTVTSRKGRVSRNSTDLNLLRTVMVTSRKGRVSRNGNQGYSVLHFHPSRPARGVWVEILFLMEVKSMEYVTSRKGRVSRNSLELSTNNKIKSHVPQGACE